MKRIPRILFNATVLIVVVFTALWGALAIWYKLPLPDAPRVLISAGFALSGLAVIAAHFSTRSIPALGIYAALFVGLLLWWGTIKPPSDGNWSPDVARQVTGRIEGDLLTLSNVREFDWREPEDVAPFWTTRTYDLTQLKSVDMFLSYWAGPEMAHLILSFGFEGDQYLAWSVEVRREIDGGFSPIADFFKGNTLVIVAASEADVVGVRSNIRGEDVQLFRLRPSKDVARALLEEYVQDANDLAQTPVWFNSVTTNCTTVVLKMMKAVGNGVPFDWRLIVNGYLPDYGYDRGTLNTDYPLAELRRLGQIAPRAREAGLGPQFSAVIRQGVPVPR